MDFAETLVAIASREEGRQVAIAAERVKLQNQQQERLRAKELARQEHDRSVEEEVEGLFEIEEKRKLQQARSNNDYQTGLMFMLIAKKNLEKSIDGLREILWDISHSGLRPDILDKLTYLTRLAGNGVKSYNEIEERVRPILIEQAREQLRTRLEGNSHREYFIGYLK